MISTNVLDTASMQSAKLLRRAIDNGSRVQSPRACSGALGNAHRLFARGFLARRFIYSGGGGCATERMPEPAMILTDLQTAKIYRDVRACRIYQAGATSSAWSSPGRSARRSNREI